MKNKLHKAASAALVAFALFTTSCEVEKSIANVPSFRCTANEQLVLTGANYWYDDIYYSLDQSNSTFTFKAPRIFMKPVEGVLSEDSELTRIFRDHQLESMEIKIEDCSKKFTKGVRTYRHDDRDVSVRVSLGSPSCFYSIHVNSGYVKLNIYTKTDNSRPPFNASFDLDLLVRVKTSNNGETLETFPLHLTNGEMSYKQIKD